MTEHERLDRRRAAKARYREKNRQTLREQSREYQAKRREDPEYLAAQAEYQRERRRNDPESVHAIRARFAERHPGYAAERARANRSDPEIRKSLAEAQRKRYEANPYPYRSAVSRYAAANREKVNERSRAWFARNPGKKAVYDQRRRAAKLSSGGTFSHAEWIEVVAEFRHRCAYCGESRPLTMDHVIPLSRGGAHTRDNIVPACKSCNCRKGTRTYEEFVRGLF